MPIRCIEKLCCYRRARQDSCSWCKYQLSICKFQDTLGLLHQFDDQRLFQRRDYLITLLLNCILDRRKLDRGKGVF